MPPPPSPWRIRALRSFIRALPRGRYAALERFAPRHGHFVSSLAGDAGGARFDCDLADQIAREVCFTGFYEPPVTRVFQQQLTPGGVAVDVGANWGYFTLVAAAAVGARGRVLALEPDPRQYQALTRNIAANAFAHVTPTQAAAASAIGRVTLSGYIDAGTNRGVSSIAFTEPSAGAPRFEVEATTIDELTRGIATVDVVKVDVEGAEDLVLDGMREGLAAHRYRAVLIELHPDALSARGVSPQACFERLQSHGYRGSTIAVSASAYRRALDPTTSTTSLLGPLDGWRASTWPHLLWLC
jgi:FkbM family methyltransferase